MIDMMLRQKDSPSVEQYLVRPRAEARTHVEILAIAFSQEGGKFDAIDWAIAYDKEALVYDGYENHLDTFNPYVFLPDQDLKDNNADPSDGFFQATQLIAPQQPGGTDVVIPAGVEVTCLTFRFKPRIPAELKVRTRRTRQGRTMLNLVKSYGAFGLTAAYDNGINVTDQVIQDCIAYL